MAEKQLWWVSDDNFGIIIHISPCGYLLESPGLLWVFIRIASPILMNTHNICFYGELKTSAVVGIHLNHLGEAILMNTHNICFYGDFGR